MSDTGENTFDYLNRQGQLKLISRLVRFGQSLPANEFKVLLAIYDRTHGWRRTQAVIPDQHFLNGVSSSGRWDAAPLGMTEAELHSALDSLAARGAIVRSGSPFPINYSINIDWEPPGFRPMWRIHENEFDYRSID